MTVLTSAAPVADTCGAGASGLPVKGSRCHHAGTHEPPSAVFSNNCMGRVRYAWKPSFFETSQNKLTGDACSRSAGHRENLSALAKTQTRQAPKALTSAGPFSPNVPLSGLATAFSGLRAGIRSSNAPYVPVERSSRINPRHSGTFTRSRAVDALPC